MQILSASTRGAAAAIIFAAVASTGIASETVEIRNVADGALIRDAAALAEFASARDLIILGEIHDNAVHQAFQAEFAGALLPPAMTRLSTFGT